MRLPGGSEERLDRLLEMMATCCKFNGSRQKTQFSGILNPQRLTSCPVLGIVRRFDKSRTTRVL